MAGSSSTGEPKYLACARALALLSGIAAGAGGCSSSLTNDSPPPTDAAQVPGAYDGSFMGTRPAVDAAHPHDGGITGIGPLPAIDASRPYDGGDIGVRINRDAGDGSDAAKPTPYDGGFFGVRINPNG